MKTKFTNTKHAIKIMIITLPLVFMLTIGHAQGIMAGVRWGSNLSFLSGDYGFENRTQDTDHSNIGQFYVYGLFVNWKLGKFFSGQVEGNYRRKQMKYDSGLGTDGLSSGGEAVIDYLEIPLLIKLAFGRRFKVFLNIGPSVNVLLSSGNYNYYTESAAGRVDYRRSAGSDFNTVTLGILGGLGIEWNIFSNIVLIGEVRTNYDLLDAAKKDSYTHDNGQVWYYNNNKFFIFSSDLGIAYRFGR